MSAWTSDYGKHKAASLTLVEANPIGILRTAGEESHFASISAMTEVYFAEFEAGNPDAVRHCIDFYGGAGSFDAVPGKVRVLHHCNNAEQYPRLVVWRAVRAASQ